MVERQALRRPDLGNGKTTQDNIADFVLSLDQFSNFMNTQFRGMIEAEVVTANT